MVAVIGIGNVGATFIQGLDFYGGKNKVGLWHDRIAGLKPSNVKVVAAFDIDPTKVDGNLSQVVSKSTRKYHDMKDSKIVVRPGILVNGEGKKEGTISSSYDEFEKELKNSGAQVALNLISSGMEKTSLEYAKGALAARMSFVNASPAKVATRPALAKQFAENKLMLIGDDLLSQFGGTAFHKGMVDFMVERGVHISKSYQLDVGGSAETRKTMDESVRMLKRGMKTRSIGMEAPYKFESVAGTTEYTDFLGDSRNSYYWMSSNGFLGSNIVMDLTLRTNDGANAGNVLLDVVRATAKKSSTASEVISAYGFKNPPKQFKIREAYSNFMKMFA